MKTPDLVNVLGPIVLDALPTDGAVEAGHVSVLTEGAVVVVANAGLAEVTKTAIAFNGEEVPSPADRAVETDVLKLHGKAKG